jgi:hypothetical protein
MSPERKSSTAIVAGQVASALIGFTLGVVVTLLAIVDWPSSAARPALQSSAAAPSAIAAPAPAAAPPAAQPLAAPATSPAAPDPAPAPVPVAAPPPPAAPTQAAAAPVPLPEPIPAPAPAPVPVAKPPKPKTKPPEPSASRTRFVVQAGAFVSEEIAGKVATRLTGDDHPADVLVRTDDSGRAWNVVRLTEVFASRGEAERAASTLKRDDDVDTLIIRLPAAKPEDAARSADKPPEKPGEKPVENPGDKPVDKPAGAPSP